MKVANPKRSHNGGCVASIAAVLIIYSDVVFLIPQQRNRPFACYKPQQFSSLYVQILGKVKSAGKLVH